MVDSFENNIGTYELLEYICHSTMMIVLQLLFFFRDYVSRDKIKCIQTR